MQKHNVNNKSVKKKDREIVFNKCGGRCAYCGCALEKGWHVDHVIPIRRKWKYTYTKEGICTGKKVPDGCDNPEVDTVDNMLPACPSCNINKHEYTIEEFRGAIHKYVQSLNRDSTQYKMAKKFGLVHETGVNVVFYFELLEEEKTEKGL